MHFPNLLLSMSTVTVALSALVRIRKSDCFVLTPGTTRRIFQYSGALGSTFTLTRLSSTTIDEASTSSKAASPILNLYTIEEPELEILVKSWGHKSYRAKQILEWVRKRGVVSIEQMVNLPLQLRRDLAQWTSSAGTLTEVTSQVSKDGTIKRLYSLNNSNNNKKWNIESVLMPYEDGRNTACISSQVGCAMGCVFCATGQQGFARQLTAEEIYEQVARFDAQLKRSSNSEEDDKGGVSNIVFMGMGEPLANYNHVTEAVRLIRDRLNISPRKITISTVGVVPAIRKLTMEKDLPVKLAVSLHCATNDERSKLIPANQRYGGLDELLDSIRDYTEHTKRRVTFEWALIENQNDSLEVARTLGRLLVANMRRDLIHINVIPLNPTGGYKGSPTGRAKVDAFLRILTEEFKISATPRVRRGIDIDAGCGQLQAKWEKEQQQEEVVIHSDAGIKHTLSIDKKVESDRLISLVTMPKEAARIQPNKAKKPLSSIENNKPKPTTSKSILSNEIKVKKANATTENDIQKKRIRTLTKQLKMIDKLKDMEKSGALSSLNEEQKAKISKEMIWRDELKVLMKQH